MEEIDNYRISDDEKTLANAVKGKKVIVVGPSPWMNNKKFGKEIDSYDIVVRVNQGIYLPINYSEDYGSRTDIIYTSQKARDRYLDKFPPEFLKTKLIVLLGQKKHENYPPMKIFCKICEKEIVNGQNYCLNKDWVNGMPVELCHPKCVYPDLNYDSFPVPIVWRDIAKHQTQYGFSILTGVLAVHDMLCFGAESVHVMGFDFYDCVKKALRTNAEKTNVGDMYCKGYIVLKDTLRLSHKDEDAAQLGFFYKLYNAYSSRMSIDENLKRIFAENFKPMPVYKNWETSLSDRIKDKNVIVVGPAPYLIGKKFGKFIDSHDVVVRINLGGSLSQKNPEDFGVKQDVTYINHAVRNELLTDFSNHVLSTSEYVVAQCSIQKGNNGVNCERCCKKIKNGQEFFENKHYRCEFLADYGLCKNKFVMLDTEPLKEKLNAEPLMGYAAIVHLLSLEPKKLHVTGFDFYHAIRLAKNNKYETKIPYTLLYADGYVMINSSQNKDQDSKQFNNFKILFNRNKNLTVDRHLFSLLK